MTEKRTPRRRVQRAQTQNNAEVILLPAPNHTTTAFRQKSDTGRIESLNRGGRSAQRRRKQEQRAASIARSSLAQIAGTPTRAPQAISEPKQPRRSFKAAAQSVRQRLQLQRRLVAHSVILLAACVVAWGRGFPLNPVSDNATNQAIPEALAAAQLVDEVEAGNFQRVVIPISATQPQSVGGGEHEVVVDVGPALIKPAPERGPAFVATHLVANEETIADIAAKYTITPESLIAANNLTGPVAIGETLRIPRVSGVPHTVSEGETITDIAERYSVGADVIMTFPPNGLDQGQALIAGREIFVPGASLAGVQNVSVRGAIDSINQKSQAAAIVLADRTNLREGPGTAYEKIVKVNAGERLQLIAKHEVWVKIRQSDGEVAWVAREVVSIPEEVWSALEETDNFPPPPPPPPVWVWPTYGDLTSGFGYRNFSVGRFHNGIDIANRKGTPISAARRGTVIEAGWCSGYGYCVKISHGSGMVTEYGHMMSNPVVSEGQEVEAGQLIGYMGSTYDRAGGGYSTGVHLHFTIKIDGTAVNPLKYLP
ncbi:MAG: peptidoglycan DD-metalloendopeptidase family protein [Chloroflexi bacterium]|nr:peptidoglycan DD-metalloendopeptidase family protein [Chloroflexota bacterium]